MTRLIQLSESILLETKDNAIHHHPRIAATSMVFRTIGMIGSVFALLGIFNPMISVVQQRLFVGLECDSIKNRIV